MIDLEASATMELAHAPEAPPNGFMGQTQSLSECHGETLTGPDHDIWELFARAALMYPEHEAVVSAWQNDDETLSDSRVGVQNSEGSQESRVPSRPLRWTYKKLLARSERLALWLRARGCRAGMRLAGVFWNSAEWALLFWTAARLGMTFVPLDPRLVAADADFFLGTIDPTVLVVQDSDAEDAIEAAAPATLANIHLRISCSGNPRAGWLPLPRSAEDFGLDLSQPVAPLAADLAAPDTTSSHHKVSDSEKISLIVFTSGTTSKPGAACTAPETCGHRPIITTTILAAWNDGSSTPSIALSSLSTTRYVHGRMAIRWYSRRDRLRSNLLFVLLRTRNAHSCPRFPALIKAILAHPVFPGKEALKLDTSPLVARSSARPISGSAQRSWDRVMRSRHLA